jgi:phosphate transport system substrate-binding protein
MDMMTLKQRRWRTALAGACAIALGASLTTQKTQINGAGATFPDPIYQKWFSEYNKLHPEVQINYAAVGSGAGITQLTNQTVFFGASDGPMSEAQKVNAPGTVLHFPTVLGSVVPIYNIPGVSAELKFTGQVLADIFLGKLTKWNSPAIAQINPGVNLPGTTITVVHRADGSGTSYIWCDYLAKMSANEEWRKKVGVATTVSWPVGLGGNQSDGVTALVKQTPGAIGYVELVYAMQNQLSYGSVKNAQGNFIKASLETTTAAGASASKACSATVKTDCMPADFRVSITNAPGANAYPITSFTWMLFYESPKNKAQAKTMVEFMKWALTDGQKFTSGLGYAPLPEVVVQLEMEQLKKIKVQ